MNSAVENDVAALQAEIRQLREDLGKVAGTIRALTRHGAAGLQDEIAETANSARQSADRLWSGAKDRVDAVAGEVERQPLGTAIAVFIAGILLGLLFTGRRA